MSRYEAVLHQIQNLGKEIQWRHANPCPYVDTERSVACREHPINGCPTCGGIGVVYDPAVTITAIVRIGSVNAKHHLAGILADADGTVLCELLPKIPFRINADDWSDDVHLADVFMIHGQPYAAMSIPGSPDLANEHLAWRIPVKRMSHPTTFETVEDLQ